MTEDLAPPSSTTAASDDGGTAAAPNDQDHSTPTIHVVAENNLSPQGYVNAGFVGDSSGVVSASAPRRQCLVASPTPPFGPALEVPSEPPRRRSILHSTEHAYDGSSSAAAEGPSRRVSILQNPLQQPSSQQHGEGGDGDASHAAPEHQHQHQHQHHLGAAAAAAATSSSIGGSAPRKVSILHHPPSSDHHHHQHHDTYHYEGSVDGGGGPSRRKSILSQGSHASSSRGAEGSEGPSRKVSILHPPEYTASPGHGTYAQHGDAGDSATVAGGGGGGGGGGGRKWAAAAGVAHGGGGGGGGGSADSVSVASHYSHHSQENGKDSFPMKKFSPGEALAEKYLKYSQQQQEGKSWLFLFCAKCHQQPTDESWEPPCWQRVCPHPFCPSYRSAARLLALVLIGVLFWGVVFCVVGAAAAPGGQIFGLASLAICAHLGGWLISLTTLPPLIGMLLVGILMQNVGLVAISHDYMEVVSILRRVALVIILTRAGLDLDPSAMARLRVAVLKVGLVPWIIEFVVVAVSTHFLMGLPWIWGFLLGSIIAAVSPAVVVSCLFRLREKGYGVAKGIPTLIIAVSGIDDATSVAVFGIIQSLMFSQESLAYQIAQGPLSIFGGLLFGALWGMLAKFVPEKSDPFVVPLRILLLFGGGLIAVFGSEEVGFGGAGPLGCIAAAFVACYNWSRQGWEVEDNPVATAFEVFWMIFEPILFGLTGTQIKFNELAGDTVSIAFAVLITGIVIRIVGTVIVAIGSKLNLKEKMFVALACMSKATVQAALGPVALDAVRGGHDDDDRGEKVEWAEKVLVVCVLSILLTAPVGAILMTILGPRLLNKTSAAPPVVEGWRRSARPSLRDITIIDEEEDGDGVAS